MNFLRDFETRDKIRLESNARKYGAIWNKYWFVDYHAYKVESRWTLLFIIPELFCHLYPWIWSHLLRRMLEIWDWFLTCNSVYTCILHCYHKIMKWYLILRYARSPSNVDLSSPNLELISDVCFMPLNLRYKSRWLLNLCCQLLFKSGKKILCLLILCLRHIMPLKHEL